MAGSFYRFGAFVLDREQRRLTKQGSLVLLTNRAFSVLVLLLENSGSLVEKQTIFEKVWAGVAVVDDNLVQAIGEIRSVLGDDAKDPRFVQTVHRRGYRFIAPVEVSDSEGTGPVPPASEQSDNRSAPPHRSIRRTLWAAGLGAVVVTGLLVVGLLPERAPRPSAVGAQQPGDSKRFRELLSEPRGMVKPAYSPDGKSMLVVAPDPSTGVHSLFLVRPGGGAPLQLTQTIEVRGPAPTFSTDGDLAMFTSYRQGREGDTVPDVWAVPVVGGTPHVMFARASAASPSPDGSAIACAFVGAAGTAIRVLRSDGREIEVAEHGHWPRWSPDGRWIAYATSDPEGGKGHLYVVRPDASERRQLTDRGSQLYGLAWAPDSRWIVFASDLSGAMNLWRVAAAGGPAAEITAGPGNIASPTVSPDGRAVAFSCSRGAHEVQLGRDLKAPASPLLRSEDLQAASVSPDGRLIAVISRTGAVGPTLSVLDTTTQERRQITDMSVWRVRWTRDGDLLLLAAPADGGVRQVWRLSPGGGMPARLTAGDRGWDWPDISPDGASLAAARHADSEWELAVIDLRSNQERVLAVSPRIEGVRWSPDGRRIAWSGAYRPEDTRSCGLWVVDAFGGSPRRLSPDGQFPVWEPSGESLLFARFLDMSGIWRVTLDGGQPVRVRPPEADFVVEDLDIARAGAPIALLVSHGVSSIYAVEGIDF
ncbi:MAG: winged helix-turn-helix domain-containing protein [Acidobacteriota bacterium]